MLYLGIDQHGRQITISLRAMRHFESWQGIFAIQTVAPPPHLLPRHAGKHS